jgi:hypothetical protein
MQLPADAASEAASLRRGLSILAAGCAYADNEFTRRTVR